MIHLFTIGIYQPFLNLLVGIYWLLQQLPHLPYADMGIAVIIFTIILRLILLPLTISGHRSIKEQRDIEVKIKALKSEHQHDPVAQKQTIKNVFRSNRRMVISSTVNMFIQVTIALMLWRIFARGLGGEDLHLIYDFMPQIKQPFDLVFLGKYDLTHTNTLLNVLQSLLIFLVETIALLTSPFPVTRNDVIRLQVILPIVSFLIFLSLPAGKKLFVITSLSFSLTYAISRHVRYLLYKFLGPIPESDHSSTDTKAQVKTTT